MVPDPEEPWQLIWKGRDNYFNHGFYRTGHVYDGHAIGSPLFVPVTGSDGLPAGFDNNRIIMHHGGVGGFLGPQVGWKGMVTRTRSLGTYGAPFPEPVVQWSGYVSLEWQLRSWPLAFRLELAGDKGERVGGGLAIIWQGPRRKAKG
jgi:hypothetical protein